MLDWNKPLQTSHNPPMPVECIRKNLRLNNSTGTRVVVAKYLDGAECLYAVHEDGTQAAFGDEHWGGL